MYLWMWGMAAVAGEVKHLNQLVLHAEEQCECIPARQIGYNSNKH